MDKKNTPLEVIVIAKAVLIFPGTAPPGQVCPKQSHKQGDCFVEKNALLAMTR
jgi:hypothetical protein